MKCWKVYVSHSLLTFLLWFLHSCLLSTPQTVCFIKSDSFNVHICTAQVKKGNKVGKLIEEAEVVLVFNNKVIHVYNI